MDEVAAVKYGRAIELARYLERWRLSVDSRTGCPRCDFGTDSKRLQSELRRDPAFQAIKPCDASGNPTWS